MPLARVRPPLQMSKMEAMRLFVKAMDTEQVRRRGGSGSGPVSAGCGELALLDRVRLAL